MKLSKEKKIHLVLVGLGTAGVIAGLWFGLITMQKAKIKSIADKSAKVRSDSEKMQKIIVEADKVTDELKEAREELSKIETQMPSGDLFSWIVNSIKQFNTPSYKVEIPQIGSPVISPVHMFPEFPYNQATVSVTGSAYYYDFGKFLSDLENRSPYLRVQNLLLEPGSGTTPEERERLSFHMEIVTLVKTNGS